MGGGFKLGQNNNGFQNPKPNGGGFGPKYRETSRDVTARKKNNVLGWIISATLIGSGLAVGAATVYNFNTHTVRPTVSPSVSSPDNQPTP